jgi:hypothetical protein
MLMKRIPGVNFINVLHAFFILVPKITKLCFGFEIFGAKILYKICVSKTLMKLTPSVQKHLRAVFSSENPKSAK